MIIDKLQLQQQIVVFVLKLIVYKPINVDERKLLLFLLSNVVLFIYFR